MSKSKVIIVETANTHPNFDKKEQAPHGKDIRLKVNQEGRIRRYFKEDELYLTENELLRRQRKYALDRQYLFKLQNMCNRVKDLRHAFEEAERLDYLIKIQKEREAKKQSKMMVKMKLREKQNNFTGKKVSHSQPKSTVKEKEQLVTLQSESQKLV